MVAVLVGATLVGALAGCTSSTVVSGSLVTVAVSQPFTSLNPATSYGRSSKTNADVAWLTGSTFASFDDRGRLVEDTSFGTTEVVSRDPLTVRYRVSADARWSDGVAVDAADLLLAWAANSGALNAADFDDDAFVDPDSGRYSGDFPRDVVFFDGAVGAGLEHVTQTPAIEDDRTITLTYDEFVPTWQTALAPGLPAHVVYADARSDTDGERPDADTDADADAAKTAVIRAIVSADAEALPALSRAWNDAYNLESAAARTSTDGLPLLPASGPYAVSALDTDGVTLDANPEYRGSRQPAFESIRLRFVPDPADLPELLTAGEVDIATPPADPELASLLADVEGITVSVGSESVFEHLDLQFTASKSGHFADARVREAFLHVVPRQAIVDELISPLQAEAGLLDSFVVRPGSEGYEAAIAENGSDEFRSVDVARASELLTEAQVVEPEVCILFDPADARRAAEFSLIQTSAARAGFVVTDCSRADWRGLLGVAGAYDAAIFAWDTSRLGAGAAAAVFRSDAALANFNGYSDSRADALIDQIASSDDDSEISELLIELDAILWDSAYGAPLFAHPTLTAVSTRVEGVTRSPLARGVLWNAWGWTPAEPHAGSVTPSPLD